MHVVIVGGGYAGTTCAARLARQARQSRHPVAITLVNATPRFVERIRLHQLAAGQALPDRSLVDLMAGAGVRLRVGWAEHIDIRARTLSVAGELLHWDRLVLALGSQAGRLDTPGAGRHAGRLETDQIPTWAPRLRSLPAGASVVVVGGGLTGIEAATEIGEAFPRLRVSLISRGRIGADLSAAAAAWLRSSFERLALRCDEGLTVHQVQPGRLLTSQGERDFALCVWTAGFALPTLARDSGLAVNATGQVSVDSQLRSISHPEIYAAGDLAAPVLAPGHPLPMGCKSALPTGAQVADNLLQELLDAQPQAFDFSLPFHCISLGRRDGLIQWPDAAGRLHGPVLTGEAAARFKETVCQATWSWLVDEAAGREGVKWRRTGHAPAVPPTALLQEPSS